MILNGYAILDGFVSLLRLGLALAVVWLAVGTRRRWRRAAGPVAVEDRFYLVFLLAGLLLALNLLAWPLLYLLLQSYVPEWPGVMCIYGVTRVGSESVGPARFLPPLLTGLQVAKPVLVFLSGGWFVLYLVNRRTPTAPLTGRVLLGLLAAGVVAAADAAAELAYLTIPKKEEFLSVGCCTGPLDRDAGRFLPPHLLGPDAAGWLTPVCFVANAGMVIALVFAARACRQAPARWLGPLLAAAVGTLALNAVFLTEVAAPRLLHQPDHHCPYDLVERAPAAVVAVALFVAGAFGVSWGCAAGWLGRHPETAPFLPRVVGTAFRLAALAYGWSVAVMVIELLRAGPTGVIN